MGRAPCCEKVGLNRGPWTKEEDMLLTRFIVANGEGGWRHLPKAAGLLRCGKSCRLRWINYLRPGLKRGNITEEEDRIIIEMHSMLGNRWSLIAARLPGRTDNEIKNYWNTHLKKKKMKLVEKKQDQEQKPQLNLINTPLNRSSSAINKENINPIPSNPSLICPIKPCKSNKMNDNQMCFLARPLYSLDPNSLSTLPKLHDHHPNPSYLPKPSINCPGYPLTSTQDITTITPYNSVNCNSRVNIGANDGISGNDAIRVNNEGYIDEGFIFTVRNSSSSHLLLGPPANTNINTSTSTTATTRLMRAPSSASSSSSGISMERLRSTRSDISTSRNNIRAIVSFLEMDTNNNSHTTISPIPTATTTTTTTTNTDTSSSSTIDLADAFNDLVCEEKLSHHSPLFIQDSHIDHLAAADLEHLFITQDEVNESSTLLLGDDHGQAYCWDFTQQDDDHQILNSLKAHE